MPMVGELVQAGVRAHDEGIADLRAHGGEATVEDPVLRPRLGADRVAVRGHAEQVNSTHARFGGLGGHPAQRIDRVLILARHCGDFAGCIDVVAHEDGPDELGRIDVCFAHEGTHRGGRAQAARANRRDRGAIHPGLGEVGGNGFGDGSHESLSSGASAWTGRSRASMRARTMASGLGDEAWAATAIPRRLAAAAVGAPMVTTRVVGGGRPRSGGRARAWEDAVSTAAS